MGRGIGFNVNALRGREGRITPVLGGSVLEDEGRKGVVNDKDSYRTERKENWKVVCKEEVNSSREKKKERKEGWLQN